MANRFWVGGTGTAILPATDGAWCILKSDGTNWQTIAGSAV